MSITRTTGGAVAVFRDRGRRRPRRPRRGRGWVAAATGLSILLTACRFPGAVRPTVKVGLVAPFEGRHRYVGYDVFYAVQLALLEVNQEGGVGGLGVELVAYDDGADPEMAVEQAQKLAVDPDVVVALGHFREDTTVAAAGTYEETGLPLVAALALNYQVKRDGEPVYLAGPPTRRLAEALLERALDLAPAGDIIVVADGGVLEQALLDVAEDGGVRPVTITTDREGWVRDVLMGEPVVLVCLLDPVPAAEMLITLRREGWAGHVLGGPRLSAGDFLAVAGEVALGATFVTPWAFPADVDGGQQFAEAYRQVSQGAEPGPWALSAYVATWALLEGLDHAATDGLPSRQRVSAALSAAERSGTLDRWRVGEGPPASDWAVYWYQIGPDGVPVLLAE